MTTEIAILARCLYEQANRVGPRWAELTRHEIDLWGHRARELIGKLDQHGYCLTFMPPEG